MQYIWSGDRYWPVANGPTIRPVLSGSTIKEAVFEFPEGVQIPVIGKEARDLVEYVVRNNVSTLIGQADAPKTQFATPATNGNGKKRTFTQDQLNVMAEKRRKYWSEHPERWSQVHRKAAGIE